MVVVPAKIGLTVISATNTLPVLWVLAADDQPVRKPVVKLAVVAAANVDVAEENKLEALPSTVPFLINAV
ncbi:Uncharacterised protein [Yersinia frederiksenii]|nr:Uncharacterised protein [Yersinia frederiksenii]CQH61459.1 Uncharacterised protein [Yersinia frederiksenii]